MADKLYIIDGMAFAFRSYYAIKNLRDSKGRPTNAVFGFARVLLKLIREQDPSHIVVVFDAPGKTFRDEIYPAYKANRAETPQDLLDQFAVIDQLVEAFNIPMLRIPGYEADDVMGALARKVEAKGMETVLVSGDKDLLQLVTDKALVFDPNKGDNGVWYDREGVKERFGVPPEHVIDVLGLMGDSTDNVPGVRGIGEKTARKLLEEYGTLENLYAHLDDIKGKQREKLEEDRDKAFLSRDLVTIRTDVPIDDDVEQFRRREPDREKLAKLFHELEFKSLLEEYLPDASETETQDYRLVLTEAELEKVIAEMRASGEFSVDTETTSTDPMRASLVGFSMSCKGGTGYYVPVGHAPEAMEQAGKRVSGLDKTAALARMKPLLEDPNVGKIGHNIKYDLIVFRREGTDLAGITLDTMVASYLTDPSRLRHNLDEVSLHYLKRKTIPISSLIGTGSKAITFDKVPIERACEYACEDADVAWRLAEVFRPVLREQELESLFREVELPLIEVLARMEMAGVAIDGEAFAALRKEIEDRLRTLEAEIVELAGAPFQINSPKQLQKVLFEDLGLTPIKRTKTGYSTDVEVLEQLASQHPLPEKLVEYRMLEKLRGTYVEALPKLINPETGRIHTSFNQAVAATGRLSSSDPNLQNIPVRTEMGRRIREGFVPGSPDHVLISADYSQIELRILAHLSGDEALRDAFRKDLDIHTDTACRVFGVRPGDVTPEMRRRSKAVNFGVVYGISPYGLAKNIGASTSEAAEFIDRYFAQYPGVKRWIDATIAEARKTGYVKTLLNRRRYVSEITSSNTGTRRAAERVAINTPVQGTAADVIKVAMIRLDRALRDVESWLILQVHDELVVEGPKAESKRVAAMMKEIMAGAIQLDVPLKVDVGIGPNWAEIH